MRRTKVLLAVIVMAVVAFNPTAGWIFAEETTNVENRVLETAEDISNFTNEYVDQEEIIDDYKLAYDEYVYEGELVDLMIPEENCDEVTISDAGNTQITVALPSNIDSNDSTMSDDGTIAYMSNDGTALAIQGIKNEDNGIVQEGFRCLVTIENDDCEKKYTYTYESENGCRVVSGHQLSNAQIEGIKDTNYYLVSNIDDVAGSEIVLEIEEPWAYDANGNPVNTYYSIDGNTLTQTVETNENTKFPVVIDPKHTVSQKTWCRSTLLEVSLLGKMAGYTMAAKFLKDSLQNNPKNQSYANGSAFSNKIKNSSEYKAIIKGVKSDLKKTKKSSYKKTDSRVFNSTTDLYMAINNASYTVSATKKKGKWNITFTLKDKYDFDYKKMGAGMGWKTKAGILLNNYGVKAQKVKAVVPYWNYITVISTY